MITLSITSFWFVFINGTDDMINVMLLTSFVILDKKIKAEIPKNQWKIINLKD